MLTTKETPKGTKLVRVDVTTNQYTKGRVYTVLSTSIDDTVHLMNDNGEKRAGYLGNFELAPVPPSTEPDLDALILKANEGNAAIRELVRRYKDEFEMSTLNYPSWREFNRDMGNFAFFRKKEEKRVFKCSSVGEGWVVSLDSHNSKQIRIGCEKFDLDEFYYMLKQFDDSHSPDQYLKGFTFTVCKSGIKMRDHMLSWEDVKVLMAAIEKYRGKGREGGDGGEGGEGRKG